MAMFGFAAAGTDIGAPLALPLAMAALSGWATADIICRALEDDSKPHRSKRNVTCVR